MSQFFISDGQRTGASASASVLPVNIQDWFPFGLMGITELQMELDLNWNPDLSDIKAQLLRRRVLDALEKIHGDGETRQRAWRLESSKAHITVWLRTDFTQPMSESRQWPPPAENLSAQHILSSQWMFVKLNDNNGIIGITIIIIIHYVSCIRGAWWITVHKVAKSQAKLKQLSTHTHTIISYKIY